MFDFLFLLVTFSSSMMTKKMGPYHKETYTSTKLFHFQMDIGNETRLSSYFLVYKPSTKTQPSFWGSW